MDGVRRAQARLGADLGRSLKYALPDWITQLESTYTAPETGSFNDPMNSALR
jgi:hypothetical protein